MTKGKEKSHDSSQQSVTLVPGYPMLSSGLWECSHGAQANTYIHQDKAKKRM